MPVSRLRKNRKPYTTTRPVVATPPPRRTPWFSIIAVCLSVWFLFYPHPFQPLFYSVVFLPLIGIVLHGARIKPSISSLMPKDNNGGIALVLMLPMFALLTWGTTDNWLDTSAPLLVSGFIAFIVTMVILLTTHRITSANKKSNQGFVILILAIYSFVAAHSLNCVADYSQPTVNNMYIIDKKIKEGRKSNYYALTLDGTVKKPDNTLAVSRKLYESVAVGDMISLHHKHGLLGVPWTYVTKKGETFILGRSR